MKRRGVVSVLAGVGLLVLAPPSGATQSLAQHLPSLTQSIVQDATLASLASQDAVAQTAISNLVALPPIPDCQIGSIGPSVAGCLAVGGVTPEVRALSRLSCLLDAVQRWKLTAISCAEQNVNRWQDAVMWPVSALSTLRGTLARVRTLREQTEDIDADWTLDASTVPLAAVYKTPVLVGRATYERAWGRSRGPARDVGDVMSWLSVYNRNTIQARTSAAFGINGELPENTWERIGREGTRVVAESRRDPLVALRFTPQMLADRARVETNTLRMEAQTLTTNQVQRDFARYKRRRAAALGAAFLQPLLRSVESEVRAEARS